MGNKQDSIHLLDTDLLKDKKSFKQVYHWIRVFAQEVGWHYPLDLIWQYKMVSELNLPKGATIIDAGAGNGLMQFILAGAGYNVLSIDFSNRVTPKPQSWIFKIQNQVQEKVDNEYVKHMGVQSKVTMGKIMNKLKIFLEYFTWIYLPLTFLFKKNYGSIKYIKADFSKLPFIESNSVDAIVSTSAIEHNPDHASLKAAIIELYRTLKKGSPLLITTSATNKESWFHHASKGWCYNEKTLAEIFDMSSYDSNFSKFTSVENNIRSNEFLKNKIPYNYKNNPNCGLPMGVWDPQYLPVGIIKWKK